MDQYKKKREYEQRLLQHDPAEDRYWKEQLHKMKKKQEEKLLTDALLKEDKLVKNYNSQVKNEDNFKVRL